MRPLPQRGPDDEEEEDEEVGCREDELDGMEEDEDDEESTSKVTPTVMASSELLKETMELEEGGGVQVNCLLSPLS